MVFGRETTVYLVLLAGDRRLTDNMRPSANSPSSSAMAARQLAHGATPNRRPHSPAPPNMRRSTSSSLSAPSSMMLGVLIFASTQHRVACSLAREHENHTTPDINHLIERPGARRLESTTTWTQYYWFDYTPMMQGIAMSSDGQIQVALEALQS
jgi:hypothetical protein